MDRLPIAERDPFSDSTDPATYVPRIATESALVELEMALRDGSRVICLVGPAGSGKTILLNVLEERLAGDFRALRVPYPKLDPDEFCHWGLAALRGSHAEDPESALAQRIANCAAAGETPVVWIVDDSDCLPAPTLRSLLRVQRNSGGALHLLLARSAELPAEELEQAGVRPVEVELEGEMQSVEMAQYVRARLDHALTDPERRAQVEGALEQLYACSHGNPRRLHAAASVLLCFGRERLAALSELESASALPAARSDAPEAEPVLAHSSLVRAIESPAAPGPEAERVSIESLVAEAVAAEQPIEELAIAEPEPSAPEVAADPPPVPSGSEPSPSAPPPPAPRKRHRLRRFGRH